MVLKLILLTMLIFIALILLFIIGMLKVLHDIRFRNGVDTEIENDYHALISQNTKK